MQGIECSLKECDRMITTNEEILLKEGNFNLLDAIRINSLINEKYSASNIESV